MTFNNLDKEQSHIEVCCILKADVDVEGCGAFYGRLTSICLSVYLSIYHIYPFVCQSKQLLQNNFPYLPIDLPLPIALPGFDGTDVNLIIFLFLAWLLLRLDTFCNMLEPFQAMLELTANARCSE